MTNKNIITHSDYTKFSSGIQLSLALDFPILIPKDEPVRLLNEILDGLDYRKLEASTKAKAENNKRLIISKKFMELREESQNNIITDEGVRLRMNRSIQVESAFGVLKQDYGFRRFLTRGNAKVSVELLLLCFAYNVKKLPNKIQNGRCGQLLHEKKAA